MVILLSVPRSTTIPEHVSTQWLSMEVIAHSTAHTLEHLCFKGSRKYPFFGLLDTLSDRTCSRINAATSVDRTVYTLETVGWEGFVHILPIYLDHLIFPSLTDESCYTEVHHIDGTGYDAG